MDKQGRNFYRVTRPTYPEVREYLIADDVVINNHGDLIFRTKPDNQGTKLETVACYVRGQFKSICRTDDIGDPVIFFKDEETIYHDEEEE